MSHYIGSFLSKGLIILSNPNTPLNRFSPIEKHNTKFSSHIPLSLVFRISIVKFIKL